MWQELRSSCERGGEEVDAYVRGALASAGIDLDALTLDYPTLQAVMRDHRYAASWRTALSSVIGIYLISDTRDGRHYVGKADGAENLLQRWAAYAANGHGGNIELHGLDASTFRLSVLRVFDPATAGAEINAAESHSKQALDSRLHGLNRN